MEIKEQETINHHTIQHHTWSIIVYLMVSANGTYVGYKLLKYIMRYCNINVCKRGESNLQGTTVAAPELRCAGNTVNIHIQSSNESLTALPSNTPLDDKSQVTNEGVKRVLRPCTPKSYY